MAEYDWETFTFDALMEDYANSDVRSVNNKAI